MKDTLRIIRLFEDLYDGNCWLDITLHETLSNISAEQAAKKISPQWNSIWQITNHLISWRQNVLLRVMGKIIETPPDNYISPVNDTSEAAWANTLQHLKDTQHQWISFLESFIEVEFERIYPPNGHTYFEHIHGIIQHDAYHLGQIVLLAKGV